MDSPVLTAAEVAALMKCSKVHVCRLAARGEIPSTRFGHRLLFPRDWFLRKVAEDLAAWEARVAS